MRHHIQNSVAVRFSLRVPDWLSRSYGDERNRERWFSFRAALFNDGLLKCCLNQTVLPKKLYLIMDRGDGELYDRYMDRNENFVIPIFSDQGDHNQQIAADLQRGDTKEIALSRIDSDDLVSQTYFEAINAQILKARAGKSRFKYVVATNGYVTDLRFIHPAVSQTPPFVTLYRDDYAGESIYSFDHNQIPPSEYIPCSSAKWVQICHGSNVENTFKRREDSRCVDECWPDDVHRPALDAATLRSAEMFHRRSAPRSFRDAVRDWLRPPHRVS